MRRSRPRRSSRRLAAGNFSRIAATTDSSLIDAGDRGERRRAAARSEPRGRRASARSRSRAACTTDSCCDAATQARPSPSSSRLRVELIRMYRAARRPLNRSTWCSSVGSWMISASGSSTGSRERISLVVDAAERHHRRAHALRAEARECLRVTPFEKRGDRQHLGAGYDALAAPAMNPNLEHCLLRGPRPGAIDRGAQSNFEQDSTQNSLASWQSCRPER